MKNRKKLLLSLSTIGLAGLVVATPLAVVSNSKNSTSISKVDSTQHEDVSDLVPAININQNSNLSTVNGPLTYWGNTITALDWYGAQIWQLDMSTYNMGYNGQYGDQAVYTGKKISWRRSWLNWDYNRNTNTIWILGYYGGANVDQKLFAVDASTGKVKQTISLGATGTVYYVSALSSGSVMCFGTASTQYNGTAYLYNPKTNSVTTLKGDSKDKVATLIDENKTAYRWVFNNLIPVANNVNVLEIYSFGTRGSTVDDGSADQASYDVYFLLVDDNLNFIGSGNWAEARRVALGLPGYRNTTVSPQHDYFILLSGKIVTVVYNTVVVIDPSNLSDIKCTCFTMSEGKWIQSWAVDANDNLYFKFKEDSKIYKIEKETLSSNVGSSLSPTTYLDLSGISQNGVNAFANNFVIYNVYGYTGQLMMINAKPETYIEAPAQPDDNTVTKWGLAIGVTQNTYNQSQGDYKGLLNTSESFQKSADFEITPSVLSSKIPSEITQNDITTLNNSFFQNNNKYTPFTISDINDSKGTFTVTVNLYQIPWFASSLPDSSIPKTITKSYTTTNKIQNRISWKTLSSETDYDFLNTLPTNLTVQDVQSLDPFQVSFQSQTITDAKGNLVYPKKNYSITSKNDTTGQVGITVNYQYVPMGVRYTGAATDVLSYSSVHTYTVFDTAQQGAFYFMGSSAAAVDNKNVSISVSQVPQLKFLLEANTLPSSFSSLSTSSNNAGFLQFINTSLSKGYPVSKINFSLVPNDSAGTLQITARIDANNSPDKKAHNYVVTYTNLNKQNNYSFSFNTTANSLGTSIPFSTVLPSSVTEGDVIGSLVKYTGFNSNDFNISLTPDDANGNLTVSVNLSKDYATSIGASGHGFTNYSTYHTFSGFMTTDEYNKKFLLSFIDDADLSLFDFKLKQVDEIYTTLVTNQKPLTIGNTTYTNLNDLVEKLLVKEFGASIPKDWKNNTQIKTEMYLDNSLGIASFYVKIPQTLLDGSSSDLNVIANYTGFVQGNAVNTADNLSFVSNNMLKNYLLSKNYFTQEQIENLTVTEFAEWVSKDSNVKNVITYHTGEYTTKLNSDTFLTTVIANEIQRTISITVDFGDMTNKDSLSSYSIQYIL